MTMNGIPARHLPRLKEDAASGANTTPRPQLLMPAARILEPALVREMIRQRQKLGIDRYDEVWEGVYVVPPLTNNPHQQLVSDLTAILHLAIKQEGRGSVQPGANVSDRREGWEHSFRCPDVVVVLAGRKAVDCETHWMGGPDFLIEVQSPSDDTEEKIPYYALLGVSELLIIHRDTRQLRLYRLEDMDLVLMGQTGPKKRGPLVSKVVPLKFSRSTGRLGPRTVVQRTDGKKGRWTV
jgi:Uma2 family endonuclease